MLPHLILDVCCGDCQRAGDPNPPRLARFNRWPHGEVELELWRPARAQLPGGFFSEFLASGRRRPDGGITWQLRCPYGHNRPMRAERVRAAFGHFPAGQDYVRLYF